MKVVWFYFNLVIATVFLGTIVIIFGLLDYKKKYVGIIARFWAKWLIKASFVQVEVKGHEKIDKTKFPKLIFLANHSSALDILIVLSAINYNIVFLAKKQLFPIPFLGWAMSAIGCIKVDRENKDKAKESVDIAIKQISNNENSIILFPEGTRSENGMLNKFKKGGFILAIRTNIPVVPISIKGANILNKKTSYSIQPGKVEMIIADPIYTVDYNEDKKEELLNRCYLTIKENL